MKLPVIGIAALVLTPPLFVSAQAAAFPLVIDNRGFEATYDAAPKKL